MNSLRRIFSHLKPGIGKLRTGRQEITFAVGVEDYSRREPQGGVGCIWRNYECGRKIGDSVHSWAFCSEGRCLVSHGILNSVTFFDLLLCCEKMTVLFRTRGFSSPSRCIMTLNLTDGTRVYDR